MTTREDYPYTMPEEARVFVREQAPPGSHFGMVVDDFARYGWLHLACASIAEGQTEWSWMHADGGVVVLVTNPHFQVVRIDRYLEGDEAREVVAGATHVASITGSEARDG